MNFLRQASRRTFTGLAAQRTAQRSLQARNFSNTRMLWAGGKEPEPAAMPTSNLLYLYFSLPLSLLF
eukprot:Pgem_evm1s5769